MAFFRQEISRSFLPSAREVLGGGGRRFSASLAVCDGADKKAPQFLLAVSSGLCRNSFRGYVLGVRERRLDRSAYREVLIHMNALIPTGILVYESFS